MSKKYLHLRVFVSLFVALFTLFAPGSVSAQIISTICGTGSASFSGDGGSALSATLNLPVTSGFDAAGNLYIADNTNSRIRKITLATGIITTIAGNGSLGFSGDGGPATAASFNTGAGIWVEPSGVIYIADRDNYRLRMINTSGIISTIAGTGSAGFSGDGGPATAATLNMPGRVYVDASGNVYIADRRNYRIRMINTSGVITTIAGTGSSGFSGDGGAATSAQISEPFYLQGDASGNIYLADMTNYRVRVISMSSGVINTFAGNGSTSFSGDGGAATSAGVVQPYGLTLDASGNIYIGDNYSSTGGDNRVRIVNSSGVINTFAGTGTLGFSGDGGAATAATMTALSGLSYRRNAIYILDQWNSRVRRVGLTNGTPSFTAGTTATLAVCQNASATSISSQLAVTDSDEFQPETWSIYSSPSHGSLGGFSTTWLSNGGVVSPPGVTYTPTTGYTGTDAFQIIVTDDWGTRDTITVNVTVNPSPNAGTISGPAIVCVGTTINLTESATGGTWTSSNTSQATVSTTGTVSGLVVGTPTISYTVTNSCGTAYATYPITVSPQPDAGTISGATAVCVAQSITLSETVTGGTWSATNANATVTATGTVTGVTAGIDTIQYSVTNYCGTAVANYTVTINPLPSAITGPSAVCAGGNTISLSDATAGGNWTTSNASIASVNSTGTVTSTGAGSVTITYTLPATGCYVTSAVTVNPIPAVIGGSSSVCLGSAITLTNTTAGGTWTTSNSSVASVSSTGNVTGDGVGTATISYSIPSTGCYVTHTVTVTAVPPAITGTTFICVGVSSTMSNTSSGGTWTTSNASIASIVTATSSTGTMTGVAVGTATITYTNGGCYSTLSVNVGSSPGPITGPTAVCEGATVTVANATTGGTWSSSNTARATISTGGNVTGVLAGTLTISYSLGSGCLSTAAFTVNPVPAAIGGPSVVCEGGSTITLTDATSGGSWTSATPTTASVNTASGVVTGVSAGTVTISYTRLGCYNTKSITVNPQAPSVVTPIGDTMMCPGDFVVLTGPTYSTYGYQWYNGASPISGETSSYYIAYGAGNYRLQILNSYGCTSSSSPMAVTVNPVTAVATAAGATTICGGTSTNINASPTTAGLSYQWTLAGVGISGATSSTYAATASGNYRVIISNAAGCSNASAAVYVNVIPAPSNNITITGPLTFCDGGSVLATADAGAGLTYQWQSGGVDIAGATNISYTATTTGNYRVVVTNSYPCSSTSAVAAVSVITLPSANITVSGYPTFCGGGSVPMTVPFSAGNTYQWIYNGTPITGATNTSYTAYSGGNYAVRVNAPTGCVNTTTPAQSIVEMTTPNIIPMTSVIHCWGGSSILSAHTSTTLGIAYQWQFNGVDIPGATSSTLNATSTGYYSCVISLIAGGCSAGSPWMAVTEVPLPNPVITYDGTHLKTDTSFASYQWFKSFVPIAGATNYAITPATIGDYAVQVSSAEGCRSISMIYPLTSLTLDSTHTDTSHHTGGGGTTGITAVGKDDIKIFPNPAQSTLHIVAAIPLRAVITTVDGRKVIDENNARTLNISHLASGMYMLMLFDENGQMVKTEKLVKD